MAKSTVPDGKIQGAALNVNQNHGRQQKSLGSEHQINNIFSATKIPFLVLVVCNQRIGKDGNDFIKQIEGEQIGGKCRPHGAADSHSVAKVESCLGMFA
jgi:hypothetical protein